MLFLCGYLYSRSFSASYSVLQLKTFDFNRTYKNLKRNLKWWCARTSGSGGGESMQGSTVTRCSWHFSPGPLVETTSVFFTINYITKFNITVFTFASLFILVACERHFRHFTCKWEKAKHEFSYMLNEIHLKTVM